MSRFQERLWEELVRDHAATLAYPAASRDPLRALPIVEAHRQSLRGLPALRTGGLPLRPGGLAAALAALAATVVAVAVLSTTGTAPSVAYAVTQNPDGTIAVSIDELTGVAGANAQLAKLAVPVRVVAVRVGCSASNPTVQLPASLRGTLAHVEGQGVAVRPDLVPSGETLVLSANQVGASVYLTYGLYRGAPPACVSPGDSNAR